MIKNDRLKALRKQNGYSNADMAKMVGVARPTYISWESGTRNPSLEMVQKLAEVFGVSVDYLLGNDTKIDVTYNLDNESIPIDQIMRVPVLGYIAAGQPIFAEEQIVDYEIMCNPGKYKEGDLFFLTVKGDSMIGARIYDGDRVLVRVQPDVEDGEIAVVNVDGENATLKRVKRINGHVLLLSENPKYEPIVIKSSQARICGKVIQVVFDPHKT
jgi:SOS regulatory protein LexA